MTLEGERLLKLHSSVSVASGMSHNSAFNLFVFPNSMFTPLLLFFFVLFLYERAMSSPEK